jgi:hypothetical protein
LLASYGALFALTFAERLVVVAIGEVAQDG